MENIEIYFESIKQVYNQILEWRKEKQNRPEPIKKKITTFFVGSSVVLFLLSLIPIIPSLLVYLGSRFSWIIFGFHLNQATFLTYVLAWILVSAITLSLIPLSFWVDNKINPLLKNESDKSKQTLSPEQISFILTYQSYKELKIFFISHIDQHVENALSSLKELERPDINSFSYASSPFRSKEDERRYISQELRHRTATLPSLKLQIPVARDFLKTFEKYSWFHIDDLTKSRLQALISFQKKIIVRLRKREDLPAVLNVLGNLSKFLYAFLPEHQTNMSADDLKSLQIEGIQSLDKFVEDVNKLIDYPTEQRSKDMVDIAKELTFLQKIQVFFNNVFFRFFIWLLILIAITSGLVYVASLKITNLDINIMISTIIATSVTGATALAVIGAKSQRATHELRKESIQKLRNNIDIDQDEA